MCRVCLHLCHTCNGYVGYGRDQSFLCSGNFWGTCGMQMLWFVRENFLCNPCIQRRIVAFVYGAPDSPSSPEPTADAPPPTIPDAAALLSDDDDDNDPTEYLTLSLAVRPVSGDPYELEVEATRAPSPPQLHLLEPAPFSDSDRDLDSLFSDIDEEEILEATAGTSPQPPQFSPHPMSVLHSFVANGQSFHQLLTGAVRLVVPDRLPPGEEEEAEANF